MLAFEIHSFFLFSLYSLYMAQTKNARIDNLLHYYYAYADLSKQELNGLQPRMTMTQYLTYALVGINIVESTNKVMSIAQVPQKWVQLMEILSFCKNITKEKIEHSYTMTFAYDNIQLKELQMCDILIAKRDCTDTTIEAEGLQTRVFHLKRESLLEFVERNKNEKKSFAYMVSYDSKALTNVYWKVKYIDCTENKKDLFNNKYVMAIFTVNKKLKLKSVKPKEGNRKHRTNSRQNRHNTYDRYDRHRSRSRGNRNINDYQNRNRNRYRNY